MSNLNSIEVRIYNIVCAGMRSILACQENNKLPGGTIEAHKAREVFNLIISKHLPGFEKIHDFKQQKVSRYMVVWRLLEIEADLYLSYMLCENNRYKVLREHYQELMVELATFRDIADNNETGLSKKMHASEIENYIFEFFCHLEAMRPLGVAGEQYQVLARNYARGKPFLTTPRLITRQFIKMDVDRIRVLIERYGYERALGRISNSSNNRIKAIEKNTSSA